MSSVIVSGLVEGGFNNIRKSIINGAAMSGFATAIVTLLKRRE